MVPRAKEKVLFAGHHPRKRIIITTHSKRSEKRWSNQHPFPKKNQMQFSLVCVCHKVAYIENQPWEYDESEQVARY